MQAVFNRAEFDELTKGMAYNAVFIPKSQSRNRDETHPTLNWRISLIRNGQSIEMDYSCGIGCLSERDEKALRKAVGRVLHFGRKTLDQARVEAEMVETGKIKSPDHSFFQHTIDKPKVEDVFYCILQDGEAIDHPSFEEWALAYGYDSDSRSAEAIYRKALETGLKLRSMFGESTLIKLRELFEDF